MTKRQDCSNQGTDSVYREKGGGQKIIHQCRFRLRDAYSQDNQNRATRQDGEAFPRKVRRKKKALRQRPEREKEPRHGKSKARVFQAEGTHVRKT